MTDRRPVVLSGCVHNAGRSHWELADPAGQLIGVVREVRDEIKIRVGSLLDDLVGTP